MIYTNNSKSPMDHDFHDWLEKCPVQWIRDGYDDSHVTYHFKIPRQDEQV